MTSTPLIYTLIESFDCDNLLNLGPRWNEWVGRLEQLFDLTGTTDDKKLTATLFLLVEQD